MIVPLFHKRVPNMTYQFIMVKMRSQLTGWDAKLSMAIRVSLAKSVFLAILNSFMQYALISLGVCIELEKLERFDLGVQE